MGAGDGGHQHRAHTEEGTGFRLDLYLPNVAHLHKAGSEARGHALGGALRAHRRGRRTVAMSHSHEWGISHRGKSRGTVAFRAS